MVLIVIWIDILAAPFVNPNNGEFDEANFQIELERRVQSNMTVEEIAEMYDVNLETSTNNNKNDNNSHRQRYTGKTTSSSTSTDNNNDNNNSPWFLDVFELNYNYHYY